MERIIYRKTLDLHKSGVQFTLQGFQTADNMSRTLEISLMASGDTIDLPLEQLMAVMYVTTPNAKEPSINECTIKDNNIVYDVLPLVEEGITKMQLKLIDTRADGAKGVLAAPEFAIEVSKSNTDEESATQNKTFTALEKALAMAKGVYDSRVTRIVLSPDCIFYVYYADGTVYTSDALKDVVVNGESLIAKSYARGETGVRDGEDTDNSMYYSNVSKSASAEANRVSGKATELLQEVTKHGVYTAFSINFETGVVEYISPHYSFVIDPESGELEAIGEAYSPKENIDIWLNEKTTEINQTLANNAEIHSELYQAINNESTTRAAEFSNLQSLIQNNLDNIDILDKELDDLASSTDEKIASVNGVVATNTGKISENAVAISNNASEISNVTNYANNLNERLSLIETIESKEYPGCFYRMVNGEEEWINPPMKTGSVYRTTERFKGEPVYVRLVYGYNPFVGTNGQLKDLSSALACLVGISGQYQFVEGDTAFDRPLIDDVVQIRIENNWDEEKSYLRFTTGSQDVREVWCICKFTQGEWEE